MRQTDRNPHQPKPMPDDNDCPEPAFYTILGLTGRPPREFSQQDVKAAYHRTLLRYHPDKVNASVTAETPLLRQAEGLYTIDQITEAYKTLASPVTRTTYDRQLELSRTGAKGKFTKEIVHNGVEVHDLENFVHNEDGNFWSRGCRCGDPDGYVLTETELERESSEGEIYVACNGCSLWVKVLFGMTESDREMEEDKGERRQSGAGLPV